MRSSWASPIALSSTAIAAGAGTSRAAKPTKATDIGVTPTEIKIAVVADVDTPLSPGLFQGVVDGFNGFAKYINANGGLAGRKVVVDFHDSKLSGSESRNAMITSCTNDFAVVSAALFLANVDDVEQCKDSTGAVTGLPDLATLYTSLAQQCSKTTYAVNPPAIVCSTATQHPQTYQANIGRGELLQEEVRQGAPRYFHRLRRPEVGPRRPVRRPGRHLRRPGRDQTRR